MVSVIKQVIKMKKKKIVVYFKAEQINFFSFCGHLLKINFLNITFKHDLLFRLGKNSIFFLFLSQGKKKCFFSLRFLAIASSLLSFEKIDFFVSLFFFCFFRKSLSSSKVLLTDLFFMTVMHVCVFSPFL